MAENEYMEGNMKNTISYDSKGLIINGKHAVLIGGEFHYFRTSTNQWEDRIRKMAMAGCNLVTTYIPWNWHEKEEGKLRWDGEQDLGRFLELCKKYKLYVIVKPGPYICGEWDFGGYPHWLLNKNVQLRCGQKSYLDLTEKWFKSCAEIIRPYLITNGGNIVMIQVENEYDHLIKKMPEITGTPEDAKKYILTLLKMVRNAGIDIPAFSNDGTCIFGTEIINTNTYYPNIPWIVMWTFDYFDDQMEENLREQPHMPLIVMEAQGGWFSQYGYDIYYLPLNAFEAVSKSITMFGASVLNYYMFAGGTNLPYWGSKGDFGGIGMTTTYDFGAASIREWGEIHDRYSAAKLWACFLKCFPEIISEGELSYTDVKPVSGAEKIACLYRDKAAVNRNYSDTYQELKVISRKSKNFSAVLLRNLEDERQEIKLEYFSNILREKIVFPIYCDITMEAKHALVLPLDFTVSNDVKIVYSTSEIVLRKKMGNIEYIFMKGKDKSFGEMLLISGSEPAVLEGTVKIGKEKEGYLIRYPHGQGNAFRSGNATFIVFEDREALKVWMQDDFILWSEMYHMDDVVLKSNEISLKVQMKPGEKQKSILWTDQNIRNICLNGKTVPLRKEESLSAFSFETDQSAESANKIHFAGNWRYTADSEESKPEFDDSEWKMIPADIPLEKAGFYDHGFYWYRTEFEIKGEISELKLDLKMNEMDRYLLYVNGKFLAVGTKSIRQDLKEAAVQGRNVIAVLYAYEFHTKAHPHEGPVQKVSGLYEPVSIIGKVDEKDYRHDVKSYKVRAGLGGDIRKYFYEIIDDSGWIEAPLSEKYILEQDAGIFAWFRRKFTLDRKDGWEAPVRLTIKNLKERCLIYVNGTAVSRHENCGPQTEYYIPENILKKDNILTMYLEGPGFHYRKNLGFRPAFFEELKLDFFYQAKKNDLEIFFQQE